MAIPIFDAIPVIQSASGIRVGFATVAGLSTRHGSTDSDGGKLYSDIVDLGAGVFRVDLWSDYARSGPSLVLSGQGGAGDYIALVGQGTHAAVSGRVQLMGEGAPQKGILIASFATDGDVFANAASIAEMPGYDPTYGLASFHAAAIKQILLSDLPSIAPNLFDRANISAFVPLDAGAVLPDLRRIQAPESLRVAQANLVKAMSAEQAEHLEEFADMADAARGRYDAHLARFGTANAPKEAAAQEVAPTGGISFGEFTRG